MPSNKNASFRHSMLNECFCNSGRTHWTKIELIERISEKMREHGFLGEKNISESTLDKDIHFLKHHRNAPIKCKGGYFHYSDPSFNLEQVPLHPHEIKILQEAFALLRQFPNLPHLEALESLLLKLNRDNEQIYLTPQLIQFENNPEVKGLNWLGQVYTAIAEKQVLNVNYQPFNLPLEKIIFHPYLLKEWRNRWFAIGRNQDKAIAWTLALDRIQDIHPSLRPFMPNDLFDPVARYQDVIGVTVNDKPVQEILFRCEKSICGYLETKPLHPSQRLLERHPDYDVFSIRVIPNQEALGELLRYGKRLTLLSEVEL